MNWASSYKVTLRQLSTPSLYGERNKLENSIKHLRRSNDELIDHGNHKTEDMIWIESVVAENKEVIFKQMEQVKLVKDEISDRGVKSEHADDAAHEEEGVNSSMNGNNAGNRVNSEQSDGRNTMELDEPSNGIHL